MKENIVMEKKGVKNLKKLLMKLHCVSKEQALFVLYYYDDKNPEATLNSLIKSRVLFEVGSNGVSVTPNTSYSFSNIVSTWLIIKYLDQIDINNIYLAQEPSSVFFLMNDDMYEVALIDQGREGQIVYALSMRGKLNESLNYIALVSEPSQLDDLYEEHMKYDGLNIIYALITGTDESGMLNINIMSRE